MSQQTISLPLLLIISISLFSFSYSSDTTQDSTPSDNNINNNNNNDANNQEQPDFLLYGSSKDDDQSDGGGFISHSSGVIKFNNPPQMDNDDDEDLNPTLEPAAGQRIVNVDDFGARGDGTDDTMAFKRAWKVACSSRKGVFLVPANRIYHLKAINFSGPCRRDYTMVIDGQIRASMNQLDYPERKLWLVFRHVHNFKVFGGGIISGNGQMWWKNSCKINKALPCVGAPTAVTFLGCKNLRVDNLTLRNAQQFHLHLNKCEHVRVSRLKVHAPKKSPNTDGIHVSASKTVRISKSVIRTGDDCISIVNGSKDIRVSDIICGPGHGISIGSLGKNNMENKVSNIIVTRAILSGTSNGVRIKTWQGGSGFANNIKFENILMHNVSNPIIINQYYCDRSEPCAEQRSAVQVKDVVYKNIMGTSLSKVAIKLNCSRSVPCRGIHLQDINLQPQEADDSVTASCNNALLSTKGNVFPGCSS